jgi:tetratricopeptide (TPR) repeat protein
MKPCLFISLTLALLLSQSAPGQTMPQGDERDDALRDTASAAARPAVPDSLPNSVPGEGNTTISGGAVRADMPNGNNVSARRELMHRIDLREDALRRAKDAHASDSELGRIYLEIGIFSEEAQLWERAETNLEHARALFVLTDESSRDVAMTLSELGNLHVVMRRLRQSEKEEEEALRLRENLRDPLLIARSWNDLAILYVTEHKYAKAKGFAQQAMAEFAVNTNTTVYDRVSVRYALGLALCMSKDCASALVPLVDAVRDTKANLPQAGLGDFLLGYAFWKSGNLTEGGRHMEGGIAIMNEQLGVGAPSSLAVSRQYAKFLRESRRIDEAEVVERRIRQAEAVVDVHSIQAYQGGNGLAGLR